MSSMGILREFLQHASAEGSRSTALKPLGWLIAMLLSATVSSYHLAPTAGISSLLAILCVLTVVAYFGAYFYLLFRDRDALRSETYSLRKMAIEKGLFGDSITGTVNAKELRSTELLASEVVDEKDDA